MDQDSRLARAGAGQHQDAGLFSVVGDNALLDGILQVFHNGPPRLRRGLARNLLVAGRQPAAQKILLLQAEIVHDESQRVGHGLQAALDVLRHDVNLEHLVLVMELERCEVGVGEAALFLTQTDGHGGAEYGQSLIEADDFLFVQPQQGTVQQSFGIPDRRSLTPGQTGSRSTVGRGLFRLTGPCLDSPQAGCRAGGSAAPGPRPGAAPQSLSARPTRAEA